MDASEAKQSFEQADRLYEQYGKPLEAEHWGEYLAVHPDGRTVLTGDYETLNERAHAELGTGMYVFKVGPQAVYWLPSVRLLPEAEAQVVRRGPSSLVRRIVND